MSLFNVSVGGGHTYGTPRRRTTASSASVVCPPPAGLDLGGSVDDRDGEAASQQGFSRIRACAWVTRFNLSTVSLSTSAIMIY